MNEVREHTWVGALARAVTGVIRWTAVGGVLGGTGGLVLGAIFGALLGLIYLEPWWVVTGAAYFALCGAAAGALLGAFYAIFDRRDEMSWGHCGNEDEWTANSGLVPRPKGELRAYRILAQGGDGPCIRTPGLTSLIRRMPGVNQEKTTASDEEESLLLHTTGVSAVFRGPGQRPLPVEETVSSALRPGDLVLAEAGQLVPRDGDIVEGAATLDESMVTGVSTSVFCEAGGRTGVLGGTLVLSGRIIFRVAGKTETFSQ